jgi:hypothetical protein
LRTRAGERGLGALVERRFFLVAMGLLFLRVCRVSCDSRSTDTVDEAPSGSRTPG